MNDNLNFEQISTLWKVEKPELCKTINNVGLSASS